MFKRNKQFNNCDIVFGTNRGVFASLFAITEAYFQMGNWNLIITFMFGNKKFLKLGCVAFKLVVVIYANCLEKFGRITVIIAVLREHLN